MNKKLNMVLLGVLVVSLMVSTASAAGIDQHIAGTGTMAPPTSASGIASCGGCHNVRLPAPNFCTTCHVYPTFTLSVVANPTTVQAGASTSVTFTVTREVLNLPVSGATVTLSGAVSATGTTDASGIVSIPVNPASAGTINVEAAKTGFTSGTTTVTVTPATPVNNAPVANDQSVTTPEGTPVAVTLTASDVDGNTLTYAVVGNPAHGTLSGTAPALTYTPDAGYNGPDSFTFKANDGTVDSNTATVSITVTPVTPTPVNNAPVANDQSVTTPEGTPVAVTLTATDADGNTLTYAVASNPSHGTLSGTAPALTYTPDAGYNGSDSFTFTANDGTADSNTATVSITVTSATLPPNPPPTENVKVKFVVTDARTGRAIDDAKITMDGETIKTDDDGIAWFEITPGIYRYVVSEEHYQKITRRISITEDKTVYVKLVRDFERRNRDDD